MCSHAEAERDTTLTKTEDGRENSVFHVSPGLLTLFEGWKSGAYKIESIEEYTNDAAPEEYYAWLTKITNELGEQKVISFFEKYHPDIYSEHQKSSSSEQSQANVPDFIDEMNSQKPFTYRKFKSQLLEPDGLTLEIYLQGANRDLFQAWDEIRRTPRHNLHGSLPNYINNNVPSERVLKEAITVLRKWGVDEDRLPTGKPGEEPLLLGNTNKSITCNCEVGLSAVALLPTPNYFVNHPEVVHQEYNNSGNLRKKTVTKYSTMGLAHGASIHRVTYNGRDNSIELDPLVEATHEVSLWMNCINNYGNDCGAMSGCNAEIAATANYYSDLKTDIIVNSNGALNKKSTAKVAESFLFSHSIPGLGGAWTQDLMYKELESGLSYHWSIDTGQLLALVGTGLAAGTAGLTAAGLAGATASSTAAAVLPVAAGGLPFMSGLVDTAGEASQSQLHHLNAVYNTQNYSANIPLDYDDGITKLTLKSMVALSAKGENGGSNSGWAQGNSSFAFAMGVKNFSCTSDVTNTPDELSYWTYGNSPAAPAPTASLQNIISGFLDVEMGQTPDFSTGNSGEILTVVPEIPPQAVCGISPNVGINSLSAIMDGTNSVDPDGDITNALFEWVRFPGSIYEDVISTSASDFLFLSTAPLTLTGGAGIHLRVTDTQGLSDTSYCGQVKVMCVDQFGVPCPVEPLTPISPGDGVSG
jgi:hypothetical protein